MDFFIRFEEHRAGRVDSEAAIAVLLRESAALDYHDHRPGMEVPPGVAAGLKYKLRLQHIGPSLCV
jgi:hypothetical protein